MTIKNNGGVFGRNLTFNDVTIEGQLTFDGDIDVNSDLKVDGNLFVTGTGDFDGDLNVPDADLSKEAPEVVAIASVVFTDEAKAAYAAAQKAQQELAAE